MRTGFLLAAVVVTLASLAQPEEALAKKGRGKSEKVMVCHRGHEIMVSERAVDAHLAHGDFLGECSPCDPPLEDDGKVTICRHKRRGDETKHVRPGRACRLVAQGKADFGACEADEPEPTCDELDSDSDGADDCFDLCPGTLGDADADGCDCSQRGDCDSDGDGVFDPDDACPGTPEGDEVYGDGCTVITLSAFAGPDVAALPGDIVDVVGQGSVLTGDCPEGDLVYAWEQVSGDPVDFEFSSPPLTVYTEGSGPEATFRLTVSTPDGSAEATDEFTISIEDACELAIAAIAPSAGKDSTSAQAVNDSGQVTGFSYNRDHVTVRFPDEDRMGFLYDGATVELGSLGYGSSHGLDISESGAMAVFSRVPEWQVHAAFWESGIMTDVHGFDYGQVAGCNSSNLAVDNTGRMGGWAEFTSEGPWRISGALYVGGVPEEIGIEGYKNAIITDLADNGDVLLYGSHCGPYGTFACPEAFILRDDTLIQIGPVDGFVYTRPNEITENGMVAGTLEGGSDTLGFVYDGAVTTLPPLSGETESAAEGMNEAGLVVGRSGSTATIWIDGAPVDLNGYLPADSGWVLTEATGINNSNVVVGSGELDGEARGFVLSLCD